MILSNDKKPETRSQHKRFLFQQTVRECTPLSRILAFVLSNCHNASFDKNRLRVIVLSSKILSDCKPIKKELDNLEVEMYPEKTEVVDLKKGGNFSFLGEGYL